MDVCFKIACNIIVSATLILDCYSDLQMQTVSNSYVVLSYYITSSPVKSFLKSRVQLHFEYLFKI